MNYSRLNQDNRLVLARQTITIVKNDEELRTLLLKYGVDDARLDEGLGLQEAAQLVTSKRVMDFGSGIGSSQNFQASLKKARKTYGEIRRILRVAIDPSDRGMLTQLRMNQPTSKRIAGFIAQAQHFYTEALAMPGLMNTIARFNITPAVLEAGLAELNAMEQDRMRQKQQRGLAQVTAQQRKAVMAELDVWMKEFLGIVRIATSADPQQMEKLGVTVK